MSADKRWRLICYDIREPARWREVYKVVTGVGTRVQYSIYRARMDNLAVERLRWELSKIMSPDDALLIVDLCPRCATSVISQNHVEGWEHAAPSFRIIGGGNADAPDHAPSRVNIDGGPESREAESLDEDENK